MRILGERVDGAVHLSVGHGLSVILRGERVSKAVDEAVIEGMGPWTDADNQLAARRRMTAKLELASVVPLETLVLSPRPYTPAQAHGYRALVTASKLSLADAPTADKSEHPFTYCKEVIVPAMAKDGKEPDDPDAFCSWYKAEGPGSE